MSLDIYLNISVDTGAKELYSAELYEANYTHNVTPMWEEAGVYDALYMSDGDTCGQHIPVLLAGITNMLQSPQKYRNMNPENGWGEYDSALKFLQKFTEACQKHPKTIIEVSK